MLKVVYLVQEISDVAHGHWDRSVGQLDSTHVHVLSLSQGDKATIGVSKNRVRVELGAED